jgi:hypothetical protein
MTNKENIVLKMLKKPLGLSFVLAGAAAGTYLLSSQASARASAPKATTEQRVVISQTLPNMNGGHREVKVVEVACCGSCLRTGWLVVPPRIPAPSSP